MTRVRGPGGGGTIFGTTGADTLVGTAGADTMAGLAGNDEYIVNHAGDVVVEASGEGTDTVLSSVSYSLADYVDNLTLTGSDNINGTGNSLANVLVGNSGSNILLGGAGNDLLSGGPEIDWAGQVFRLYEGVLGREPDVSGFDHHVGHLRGGMPLQTAAGYFIGSPEFQANIGSLNDTQFVTLLYNNALHRAPDPGGLDNWVGALGNGMTRTPSWPRSWRATRARQRTSRWSRPSFRPRIPARPTCWTAGTVRTRCRTRARRAV